MNDSVALQVINNAGGIITAVGVILIGYWQYRAKILSAKTAKIAEIAAEKAAEVKTTIESTKETAEDTNRVARLVAEQTDGHLTAMEKLLNEKTEALQREMAKVARLTQALHEARGTPLRRDDDPNE